MTSKSWNIKILFFFIVLLFNSSNSFSQGFLHRQEKKIVDGSGHEIQLKGIGLGGWLVQEGYMLQTSKFANAQWEIRKKIVELIGESNTELFYETYRKNYVRKIDIDSIKSWGFNSIRLPFHYNLFATNTNPPVFINKGFEIIDSLLFWCKENQIYLILDMHAAPGGQSDENISDYNPSFPSLWQSNQNKDLTVMIWRKIAERYKDEMWIGGYDLLNEPKWSLPPNNQPLRDLYIRITDTIRAVDNNHLLFIEGNWFATDFSGLTPAWDENMAYSFHKYWSGNNQSSIQYLIDLRNNTNRPLWLGETGENSNKWFTDCVELLNANNIGWAWWPHKKIESIAGPLSAYKSASYKVLLNYWNGSGAKPNATFAYTALVEQAELLLLENCRYQKDVVDALIRQPGSTSLVPFAENQVPGIIHAADYDLGKLGYAYNDIDFQNIDGSGGPAWNSGWSYRNDGVDIEWCNDLLSNGYNIGWIETGEWLKYTINAKRSAQYDLNINLSAPNAGGKILLYLDGKTITSVLDVPATGGWQNWQYLSIKNIYIPQGSHTLQISFFFGGFNFSFIEFLTVSTEIDNPDFKNYSFQLEQNFPNPFNPTTQINYSIASASIVIINIYNLNGELIKNIVNEYMQPGNYSVKFDAERLSSGVYLCSMKADNFSDYKKIILLK